MTKEELKYVKEVYDNIIMTSTHLPKEIIKAYRILSNDQSEIVNHIKARKYVFNYFRFKDFQESMDNLFSIDEADEKIDEVEQLEEDISSLEKELEEMEDIEENKTNRRVLKSRITKLKKKL